MSTNLQDNGNLKKSSWSAKRIAIIAIFVALSAVGAMIPVRPTLNSMAFRRVSFSSGGNLYAIAQRGLLAVLPKISRGAQAFNFKTTPSISYANV